MIPRALLALLFTLSTIELHAAAASREVTLARTWAAVRFLHPEVASGNRDWELPLIAALTELTPQTSEQSFQKVIATMLGTLHDPATRIIQPPSGPTPTFEPEVAHRDGTCLVTIHDSRALEDFDGAAAKLSSLTRDPTCSQVVFDLRADAPISNSNRGRIAELFAVSGVNSLLVSEPARSLPFRRRVWTGFPPDGHPTKSIYHADWVTADELRWNEDQPRHPERIIFLINRDSDLPPIASALQALHKAVVLFSDDPSDEPLVGKVQLEVGNDITIQVRTSELAPGSVLLAEHVRGDPLATALSAAKNEFQPVLSRVPTLDHQSRWNPRRATNPYPSEPERLLAVIKLWAVVEYLDPHKELAGSDWDEVLRHGLSEASNARNASEYASAIAHMAVALHDSHAGLESAALTEVLGIAPPPFRTNMVEGNPVITEIFDDDIARSGAIKVGDIVLRVDGENAMQRIAHYKELVSASTPQSADRFAMRFTYGPDKSVAHFIVSDSSGVPRDVDLVRQSKYRMRLLKWRHGDVVRILDGNIGYVDLDRLQREDVDPMFEKLRRTDGIIFDMRGYPAPGIWTRIAPRLAKKSATVARLEIPLLDAIEGAAFLSTTQTLTAAPTYTGPTAMLIDERAVSAAEHAALWFHAAGTTLVGTPTQGADGNVSSVMLPGNILVSFTGSRVVQANGTSIQRHGIEPDVTARPTIEGIRKGIDEVLEAGRRVLLTKIAR